MHVRRTTGIGLVMLLLVVGLGTSGSEAAPESDKTPVVTGKIAADEKFTVWTQHGLRKVQRMPRPERIRNMEKVNGVRISAAANERASFQVIVTPHGYRRRNQAPITYPVQKLQVSSLNGPDGEKISSDNINVRVVGYINGVHPDVLFPKDAFKSVPDRQNYNLWITVSVPPERPAGDYTGSLNLTVGHKQFTHGDNIPAGIEKHQFEIPFTVHVWDFKLPKRTHVWPNHFSINGGGGELTDRYPVEEIERLKKDLFKKFAARRISPRVIMPGQAPDGQKLEYFLKWAQWWVDRGLYLGRMGDSHARIPISEPYLTALRERGWMDRILTKIGGDESYTPPHTRKRKQAERLEKIAPDLKRLATFNGLYFKDPGPERKLNSLRKAAPAVDVFSINPGVVYPYPKVVEFLKKKDHEMSWYIHHHLKVEEPAIKLRAFFWKMWKENVRMMTLWATCLWERGDITTKNAPRGFTVVSDRLGIGNGTLFWPTEDNVSPSIRSDIIRDGIEDFEYHWLLRKISRNTDLSDTLKQKVNQALNVPPAVVKDFFRTANDPTNILEQRSRVARLIETVKQSKE